MGTKKTIIGAAGLAAALGVGGVIGAGFGSPGVSGAQTPDEETTTTVEDGTTATPPAADEAHRPFGEHLAAAADAIGITEDELTEALAVDGATIASVAEANGVDVQAVIDAIVADSQDELVERVTALVNGEFPEHGPGGPGRGDFGGRGGGLDAVATALGLTVDELHTQLEADDATIASVAEANGVDVQTVIDAIVAARTAEIDAAEADGTIDADRATELRDALTERVTAFVNGEFGGFGPGPGGGFGPGRGHGGPPMADDGTDDTTD